MENQKKSWWSGFKTEFKKITWPTRDTLAKQTVMVSVTSVIIGCAVALMDFVIRHGVEALVNFPAK